MRHSAASDATQTQPRSSTPKLPGGTKPEDLSRTIGSLGPDATVACPPKDVRNGSAQAYFALCTSHFELHAQSDQTPPATALILPSNSFRVDSLAASSVTVPLAAPAASSSFSMSLTMNSGSPVAFSNASSCVRTFLSVSTTVGSHLPGAFESPGAAGAGAAGAAAGAGAAAAAASILSREADATWYFAFQSFGSEANALNSAMKPDTAVRTSPCSVAAAGNLVISASDACAAVRVC